MPPPGRDPPWRTRLHARPLHTEVSSVHYVSVHYVGRVLRQHGIHLQRRRSHEVSTDPEFSAKAADIVGLYL